MITSAVFLPPTSIEPALKSRRSDAGALKLQDLFALSSDLDGHVLDFGTYVVDPAAHLQFSLDCPDEALGAAPELAVNTKPPEQDLDLAEIRQTRAPLLDCNLASHQVEQGLRLSFMVWLGRFVKANNLPVAAFLMAFPGVRTVRKREAVNTFLFGRSKSGGAEYFA